MPTFIHFCLDFLSTYQYCLNYEAFYVAFYPVFIRIWTNRLSEKKFWHYPDITTVEAALAVSRLSRKSALAVEMLWSQIFHCFMKQMDAA